MNILLVGEYSRLHNSLKEGLTELGHRVVIVGFKDGFKNFPVDYPMEKKWDTGLRKKIKAGIFRLSGFDLSSYLTYRQFQKHKNQLTGFDVVQLINENSFFCEPYYEKKMLRFLFENNQKIFLLSCGDDYANVQYAFAHPEMKSPIQPYLMGKIQVKEFGNVMKYRKEKFRLLHEFIYENIHGVIASDLDYRFALEGHPKYLGMIPNPVNTDTNAFTALNVEGKITIFLGINTESYYKKGFDYFEEALEIIRNKYPEQADIIITRNIAYRFYIRAYNSAHILLDQIFANDQGYNALEAMAKGKVVFTGAEKVFTDYYHIQQPVNINAVADVQQIVDVLSNLIENPEDIHAISSNARAFIEKEHDYKKIASQYLDTWARTV